MNKEIAKQNKRLRRKAKIRVKVSGSIERPRLSIFRSNTGVYAQIIDDTSGKTLVSVHPKEIKNKKGAKESFATEIELGKLLAEKAIEKKISEVVFDRSGYKYHGRIKAFADAARGGGLKF